MMIVFESVNNYNNLTQTSIRIYKKNYSQHKKHSVSTNYLITYLIIYNLTALRIKYLIIIIVISMQTNGYCLKIYCYK